MASYLGVDDDRLPAIPKPSLQQYDNYQIYDIYCEDIIYTPLPEGCPDDILMRDLLAVQKYHPTPILFDFDSIAQQYP
ncbi:MAG: hypothetical protein ACRC80_29895 [Waterburya sp.]